MNLEPDVCYQALLARDPRFDGRFFVGVASTGVYCRPVCPARAPKRDHCRFYASAAAAEDHGFRPCLRCRPELAPGRAGVDAASRLAASAASLIEDGSFGPGGLADLADRLGVTDRHLRRVFRAEFGVSPMRFAQTQRLLLAKRLLTDTGLSVLDVALAGGFASLRRFNQAFKTHYRLTPTELRRRADRAPDSDPPTFRLGYRPPLDWDRLLDFLGARTIEGVERLDGRSYARTVRLVKEGREYRGWIEVLPDERVSAAKVRVDPALIGVLPAVLGRVRRLFDLGCRPDLIAKALGPLAAARPGLRLPGAFDGFELAVRAVLGQQVTVRAARTVAGRFAAAFGDPAATPFPDLDRIFPKPERLAETDLSAVATLGMPGARARTILSLAKRMASGDLGLDPAADVESTIRRLVEIPGIGEWTAQYIAMRALSWPDAFPVGDYGVKKAMGETKPSRLRELAEPWRPWRAYAVMHLWASLGDHP